MKLRTKLIAGFAGLSAIALLVIAVAFFATLRWQAAAGEIERHFQRSLLLQSVRANTFQALKEVDDGLTGDAVDARADFETALAPATRDFAAWAAFADTPAERDQVRRVQAAHAELVASGRRVFELIPIDRAAAIRLVDDEIDTKDLTRFREITEAAVAADLAIRRRIASDTAQLRTTAQIMLAVSAISIISLMLLIAAYLSSDLFRPLRDIAGVLDGLAGGDRDRRVGMERADEIGAVASGVDRLADTLGAAGATPAPSQASAGSRLAAAFEARLAVLKDGGTDADWRAARQAAAALAAVSALDRSAHADHRPLDLPALIHAALGRHRPEITRRGIAIEQHFPAPAPRPVGRPEAIDAALDAMLARALDRSEDGGRIGVRAYVDPESGATQIEVADDARAADSDGDDPRLAVLRAVAESHGGAAKLFAHPRRGSVAQLTLPT